MARIGYGKIGRSWNLDAGRATSVGGDIDVVNALMRLAQAHPEHEFVLVGKNSGQNPQEFGFPSNVTNPWTEWKKNWTSVPEPAKADMMIDHFRMISGDFHKTLDHMIVWAGQHGSANSRIPMIGSNWVNPPGSTGADHDNSWNDLVTGGIGENLATPQYAFVHYISWYLDFISRWREAGPGPLSREEIWLCPDPRNYLKCREKRWPLRYPVLAQYEFLRYHKGERFGRFPEELKLLDPTGYRENSLWVSNVAYCYAGLELTAVADPASVAFDPRPGPHRFGMVVNENLTNVKDARLELLKKWIVPNFPEAEIRGHWTEGSQIELGRVITPVPYNEVITTMKSFATTITTPASGSEWATTKPWESFAIGSVCFFHPRYDGQGHVLPLKDGRVGQAQVSEDSKMLAQYLRINDAAQLAERVAEVTSNPDLYHALVRAQRRHYEASFDRWQGGVRPISERIEIDLERIKAGIYISETENDEVDGPWLRYTRPPAAKVASRVAARPRGTNEERAKRKPPISRRRAIRPGMMDAATTLLEPMEEHVEEANVAFDVETIGSSVAEQIKPQLLAEAGPRVEATQISAYEASPNFLVTKFVLTTAAEPIPAFGAPSLQTNFKIAEVKKRPSTDEYFINLAKVVATRTTCPRRAVGCVLVDKNKHVLATGYNGVPRGLPHCNEGHPCKGAGAASGEALSDCLATHAEINAVTQCHEVHNIETIYLTVSPCKDCIKVLMNTGATRIVFAEEYVQPEAKKLWLSMEGNEWIKL